MRYSVLTWLYLNNSYNINPDINSECKYEEILVFHSPKDLNFIKIVYESSYVKAMQYIFRNSISDATLPS